MIRSLVQNLEAAIRNILATGFSAASGVFSGGVSAASVTSPLVGTTTNADVVLRRNSAERMRLTVNGPEIHGAAPLVGFKETDQATDYKLWWLFASGAEWRLDGIDDAEAIATRALTVKRTGMTIDYVRIGATAAPVRLDVTGGLALATPPAAKTSDYLLVAASDFFVRFDTTGASRIANLPAAAGVRGAVFAIRKTVAGNTLTIEPAGAETIDGAANLAVTAVSTTLIQSDGSGWVVIGTMS